MSSSLYGQACALLLVCHTLHNAYVGSFCHIHITVQLPVCACHAYRQSEVLMAGPCLFLMHAHGFAARVTLYCAS